MLALALLAAGCAGPRGWSRGDVALDWHQTSLGMSTDGLEQNAVIRMTGPNLYFAEVAIVHLLIAAVLPGRWRTAFQATTIGVEAHVARTNCSEGYCW